MKEMIVIEASNINVGGSLNLLKDLAAYVSKNRIPTIVYISYDEVYRQLLEMNMNGVSLIKTNLKKTIIRYFKKGRKNILYFCSLPPFRKNENSYVYFHAEYYANPLLKEFSQLSLAEKVRKCVYFFILKYFHNNCDMFFCQTERIKEKLWKTYGIHAEVKPFFGLIVNASPHEDSDKEYDFIYPALCSKHKNHINLLHAIKIARKEYAFSLVLTVPESARDILNTIKSINLEYPHTIINIGVVDQSVISDYYNKTRFLIFPSMMESLGLPLLEAISNNVKVLVADREYAYAALDNPVVFNPDSVESIASCIIDALNGKYAGIVQRQKIIDSKEYIVSKFVAK